MSELAPGDQVVVDVGRHRGSKAVVVQVTTAPTPAGGRVAVVQIRRPRAGETWLFLSDVRKVDDPEPPKRSLPEGFGASGFEG